MAQLAETLEAIKRRELAQRLDAGEAEVLARTRELLLPTPASFDEQTRSDLQPWLAWTTQASCRHAPAKPFVVAQFIREQAVTGVSTEALLRRVNAISVLHDKHNLADPVATTVVRAVLSEVVAVEAPRSWRKPEKEMFVTLPPDIRAAVARREHERETQLRRLQNEVAALKKTTANSTAPNESVTTSKEETMVKRNDKGWNGPQGSADMGDTPLRKDDSALGYHKPRDISKVVDSNHKVNDGYVGPLKSQE